MNNCRRTAKNHTYDYVSFERSAFVRGDVFRFTIESLWLMRPSHHSLTEDNLHTHLFKRLDDYNINVSLHLKTGALNLLIV